MKFFKFITKTKIKDEDLMRMAEIEYKNDAIFAFNWLKENPGKTLNIEEYVK